MTPRESQEARPCLRPRCLLALAAFALGCPSAPSEPPDPVPAALVLPDPDDLPFRADPPPLLERWSTAETISTPAAWRAARPEQIALLQVYVYGTPPPALVPDVEVALDTSDATGRLIELTLTLPDLAATPLLAVFLPPGEGPFPVLLGLNKCGNHTVIADPRLAITDAWLPSDCVGGATEASRGSHAASWPLDLARAAGWAVATLHQNQLVPDDRAESAAQGLLAERAAPDPSAPWGAIAAWAWGLSRAADALESLDALDSARVVPFGHSRRGKAALLAAALDERFAAALPHQSGTAGVTLTRSDGGESVASITTLFPHWFTARFRAFADNEGALPFDQHHLVALLAPRPLLATDGAADTWADPPGAAWAIELARPAWELLAADTAPVQILREGGHEQRASDWVIWLDWLETEGI